MSNESCARLIQDNLRRQVVWGAAERVCPLAAGQPLGEAQVRHLDVPIRVQQQVLWLPPCTFNVQLCAAAVKNMVWQANLLITFPDVPVCIQQQVFQLFA